MKPKELHFKQLSVPFQKSTADYRGESPSRTPTTVTSFSFSSQDFAGSHRRIIPTSTKAKEPKSFHEEYLEFGLWPDLSLHSQSDLKTKYKAQKTRTAVYQIEAQKLRTELAAATVPCSACAVEKAQHQGTKRALEEAVALSSVLLRQVLDMGGNLANRRKGLGKKQGKSRKYAQE